MSLKYTIKEVEGMLAHGVRILSMEEKNQWLELTLSREFGQGDITIKIHK